MFCVLITHENSFLYRMSYGTGEWRQLLLDMQEIVDWLSRAGQELMSQQPIASDIEMVQQQNRNHQVSETKNA